MVHRVDIDRRGVCSELSIKAAKEGRNSQLRLLKEAVTHYGWTGTRQFQLPNNYLVSVWHTHTQTERDLIGTSAVECN